jgi:endonuclease/exonuclease/phosphatase family metal-dependent hydrolase
MVGIWLFLLQAIRVLFASIFGVLYDALFAEALALPIAGLDLLLVLLAVLAPLLRRRFGQRTVLEIGAPLLVFGSRVLLSLESPTLRLYASIVLLAGAAFYLSRRLWQTPERLAVAFLWSLAADQILRALDFTYDPTLRPAGLPFVLGGAAVLSLVSLYLTTRRQPDTTAFVPSVSLGLAIGGLLFLETSLLALPNALSRWSGVGYMWTVPLLLFVTLLPSIPAVSQIRVQIATSLWPVGGLLTVILSLLFLWLAALIGGIIALVLLLVTQFVILINFRALSGDRPAFHSPSGSRPGLPLSLGLLLFLVLNFFFAFTFTYPYTLPIFRGLSVPVLLVGALAAGYPILRMATDPEPEPINWPKSIPALVLAVVLALLGLLLTISPAVQPPADDRLRLATYNIHYGFNTDWVFNLDEIANTIEAADVDLIVLQEVDAGRVTSYCVDDALWLGRRLGMHVVYQPTLEKLSGIALLSRYPIEERGGRWLTSELEQTAIVYGAVQVGVPLLHVYGVWLGLEPEERAVQIQEALDYIGPQRPAVLGGDFNTVPDSPVYAAVAAEFQDPFTETQGAAADAAFTSPAVDPVERIDYVWLRGLVAQDAWVSDSLASDHRMVVVEAEINP